MVIDLVGVLEVGGARGAGVPANPRKPITLQQGADINIRLRVMYSNGVFFPVALATITMAIRKSAPFGPTVDSKVATPALDRGPDQADVFFQPRELKDLFPGYYLYDVWLAQPGSGTRDPIIPLSPCYLAATATEVP